MRELQTTVAQRLETLGRLRYFNDWSDAQRQSLAVASSIVSYSKGKKLVVKGDALDSMFVLIGGEVRMYIPLPGGQERVVGMLAPGQSFGEGALELGIASPYTAMATKSSQLLRIEGGAFRRELHKSTKLLGKILAICAQRLIGLMTDLEVCAQRTSIQRVSCYLSQFQPDPATPVFSVLLEGRKMDIATRLGLTPETFSRVLGFLEGQGLLRAKGRQIDILDGIRLRGLNEGASQYDVETEAASR